ncbi:hypothetical protein EMIT074MI3_10801 [Bacillus licheniformis]
MKKAPGNGRFSSFMLIDPCRSNNNQQNKQNDNQSKSSAVAEAFTSHVVPSSDLRFYTVFYAEYTQTV